MEVLSAGPLRAGIHGFTLLRAKMKVGNICRAGDMEQEGLIGINADLIEKNANDACSLTKMRCMQVCRGAQQAK
jgi:hypothetical protein